MTNGPEARVGETLAVPFERPRAGASVLEHDAYCDLRGRMIQFLEDQDKRRHAPKEAEPSTANLALPASA